MNRIFMDYELLWDLNVTINKMLIKSRRKKKTGNNSEKRTQFLLNLLTWNLKTFKRRSIWIAMVDGRVEGGTRKLDQPWNLFSFFCIKHSLSTNFCEQNMTFKLDFIAGFRSEAINFGIWRIKQTSDQIIMC